MPTALPPVAPLPPAASPDSGLIALFAPLDVPFDAEHLSAALAGVTPDAVASTASTFFALAFIATTVAAVVTRTRLTSLDPLPRGVLALSTLLAALSLARVVPVSALVIATPLILHWAVMLGSLPGVLLGKLWRVAQGDERLSIEDMVARGVLRAETIKAVETAVHSLPPERQRLFALRTSVPLNGFASHVRATCTPTDAVRWVGRYADPAALSDVERLSGWLGANPKAAAALMVLTGALFWWAIGPLLAAVLGGGALFVLASGWSRYNQACLARAEVAAPPTA